MSTNHNKIRTTYINWIICFTVLMCNANTVLSQHYNFKSIDLTEEFGIKGISDISSSKYGYLLFASSDNIYKYDGQSVDVLYPEIIFDFSEIKHINEYLVGETYFLSNSQLFIVSDSNDSTAIPLNAPINSFLKEGNLLYLATNKGIVIFDLELNFLKAYDEFEVIEDIVVNNFLYNNGYLIISTANGIYEYNIENRNLRLINQTSEYNIQDCVVDKRGNYWSYTDKGLIVSFDKDLNFKNTFRNTSYLFNGLICDDKNRIWFTSTNKGILRFDQNENNWKIIDAGNGLPENRIVDILKDEWGSIWVCDANNKLSQFIDKEYEWFNVYNKLPSDNVTAISRYGNNLIFACKGKGILSFEGNNFVQNINQSILEESECTTIEQTKDAIWLGTNGNGAIRLRDREYTFFKKEAGLSSNWVSHIAIDSSGTTWIGTPSNGISSLSQIDSSNIEIRNYNLEDGLEDLHISALYVSTENLVYYGTQSGKIGFFRNGSHNLIPSSSPTSEITDIVEGETGSIYFSTFDSGILIYKNGKQLKLDRLQIENVQIPDNVTALEFANESLWMANSRGIGKLDFEGEKATLYSFSVVDGFPTSKVIRKGMKSINDEMWIASSNGLVRIIEIGEETEIKKPKLHLSNIEVDFIPINLTTIYDSTLSFSYNKNQISFAYEGVDINTKRDLEYSHILLGQDKLWSPWTKAKIQNFNNLSPGDYEFKVKARSILNRESEEISIPFSIKGPIWSNWWFIPALALVGLFIFFMLFRARIKVIKKKNKEEKTKLELKNRLLELEQKANQLQMNPHFIFNALNSIQATVSKEEYQLARKEINDFAVLMRSILSNSKERVIPLEDEIKLLRKYIEVEKTCRSLDFKHEINIQKDINVEEVLIPPMLIQPFVENAIVHGLKGKEKGGILEINMNLKSENILEIHVKDNGKGFKNTQNTESRKSHKSVAIQVTKERLENLLPDFNGQVLEIAQMDKVNGGTLVKLRMPIEYNY